MPPFPEFCGASYRAQSYSSSPNRLVNWYVEKSENASQKSAAALYPVPGVETFLTSAAGVGGRGIFKAVLGGVERVFAVLGSKLIEVSRFGTETVLGDVGDDAKPVSWASNGDAATQILVGSNDNGFCYDTTTSTFSQVRTGGTRVVDMLDGFGLALDVDTSSLFVSTQYDFTAWDPTDIIQRSDAPDPWIALKVVNGIIWLIGTETAAPWYNQGLPVVPFAAHPTGTIGAGIAATFAVTTVNGQAVWLARTSGGIGRVVRIAGFTPEPVSDFALSVALDQYETAQQLDDCYAESYAELGHTFGLFSFPRAKATWGWGQENNLWHERGSWDPSLMAYEAALPNFHAAAFGQHLWTVRGSNQIVTSSVNNAFDVDGRLMRRLRIARGPFAEQRAYSWNLLRVYLQAGVGTLTAAGRDPQAMLRISRNGGQTWGGTQTRGAGRVGEYKRTLTWNNLGTSADPAVEFSVTQPVPWRVVDAFVEVS